MSKTEGMQDVPNEPDIVGLLRNADQQAIQQRLDELNAQVAGLRSLLRAVRARDRVRQITKERRDNE